MILAHLNLVLSLTDEFQRQNESNVAQIPNQSTLDRLQYGRTKSDIGCIAFKYRSYGSAVPRDVLIKLS